MKLFIGGYAAGKTEYVTGQNPLAKIFDEHDFQKLLDNELDSDVIINHFHLCVRKLMQEGRTTEYITDVFNSIISRHKNIIIISDEIGNGIVPMEEFERDYRELTGRLLIEIAKKSESVERIICQIPVKLK